MSLTGSVNAIPKPFHGPWDGKSKIVIGIDIGTTQSGVAFAFLQKGIDQVVHRVTQWPGQEAQNQQSKIPTLVWYSLDGKAVSFGAEALSYKAKEEAEDNSWQLARHFKLHLHPSDMKAKNNLQLDPLPNGVPLRQIYKDFLSYLLQHTRSFFEDRIVDGPLIWENYHSTMEVVIAHPNGWGLREQAFLRTAAIDAGFAPGSSPHMIRFVTEAEASVHFCIYHTNLGNRLLAGTKFAVCDAGGSTVDTTVYTVVTARPALKLEEARASSCVQAGAIFVDAAAEKYICSTLTNASLGWEDVQDYTARGMKDFESVAKRNFCNITEDKMVEIAGPRFNNSSIRTRRGRMTISGAIVKSFFDICVDDISESVDQQMEGLAVSYLLLVGGFGDSPYLRQCFKTRYEPKGCQVTLTNDSTSKAVADGAVIWNVTSSVVGRAPRASVGIEVTRTYSPLSPEFRGRETYICPSGVTKVDGAWSQIVGKGVTLDAEAISREGFMRIYSSPDPDLEDFEVTLLSYPKDGYPTWAKDDKGDLLSGFRESCTITANLQKLSGALESRIGIHGRMYWRLSFDVCIRFGGTEWEAYLEWEENGITRTGEVTIIPESVI
ncbi:heat shock protein 70 kDa 12A [Ceratobasidium sp. AG-Ba]|nr:heat shock protein 70 kDa 12A [Ceratobasidium sp. AG-Ba]